MSDKSQIKIIF